jgi:SAM-dependent methyltransferase/Flp pilus assembly protein TadD
MALAVQAPMGEKKRRRAATDTRRADPRAAISRAVELLRSGRPEEARALCEPLFDAAPPDAEALHYLGYLAIELGRAERAVGILEQAIRLQPAIPYFHNTLAIARLRSGQPDAAIEPLRRTIALAPELHEPFNNLGNALRLLGRYAEAAACYRRAAHLAPEVGAYRSAFAEALSKTTGTPAPDLREDLLAALAHEQVDPKLLVPAAISMARSAPQFAELERLAASGQLTPEALAERRSALEDPLLMRVLESALVGDADVERLLTQVRGALLRSEIGGAPSPGLSLEFACALARQCFAAEYAWFVSTDEEDMLAKLEAKVLEEAQPSSPDWQRATAVLAEYRPSSALAQLAAALAETGSPLEGLLRQQVVEPAEEAALQAEIACLHPIDDAVSRAVRAQYESNPYPRWVRVGRYDHARPLATVLRELFPHKDLGPPAPVKPCVLIAGCGTGSHSVRSALRFEGASLLAVDLSRASLAHALRKTRELGVRNIEYAQADLLRLGELGRKFDLIECVGVLHHLRDPVAGWRSLLQVLAPDGFMRVGLYSELGRAHIVQGQAFARRQALPATEAGIRALRRALLAAAKDDAELAKVLLIRDFYSTSGCRDLLLHVQEHRFTLPRLAQALHALGLEFLGFELPAPHVGLRYLSRFPSNPAMDDLSNWRAFEEAEPDTFSGMYQFWVRRAR